MSGLTDALFGGAPSPDPAIGEAARANAAVGQDALNFSKQQYEDNKPRVAAYDALAQKQIQANTDAQNTATDRSNQQWDYYTNTFMPVEKQTVSDAMNYDSPATMEQQSSAARADVIRNTDVNRAASAREMARNGINPNSGKFAALTNENDITGAAAQAGAENGARLAVKDKAIALRAGVANFGRNMPNTSAQQVAIANNAGTTAANTAASTVNVANAGASPVYQGVNSAISGNNSAGNLLLGQFNAENTAYANNQKLLGDLGQAAGYAYGSKINSDKNIKKNRKPISPDAALKAIEKTPIDEWDYKEGIDDGGHHIGPMAQDVKKNMGETVAPGGRMIDIISANGINMAAIQALSKKVSKLESINKGIKLDIIKKGINQ